MKKVRKNKRKWRWGIYALLSPFFLFLLLSIFIYLPPVQRFVVEQVAASLAESTGVEISVEKVRLAFPLDLSIHGVIAKDETDTLADIRALRVNIKLLPLFQGRVDVDGLSLYDAQLNTKDLIPDFYLRGRVGLLSAASHGIDIGLEKVILDKVDLENAVVYVALSDTSAQDTTTSTSKWDIVTKEINVRNAEVKLSLPGDSMRLALTLGEARLTDGRFDTGKGNYGLDRLKLRYGGMS